MDRELLVIYRFFGPAVTVRLRGVVGLEQFRCKLRAKGVPDDMIDSNFFYQVPDFPEIGVADDEEWEDMHFHLQDLGVKVVNIRAGKCVEVMSTKATTPITLSTTVGDGSSSSSKQDCSQVSSSSPVIPNINILPLSTLVPQIDLPVRDKEELLTAPWANYIVGAGQKFYGGVEEFRHKLIKYCIRKGRKFKFVTNTKTQVTAKCAYHQEFNCDWFINAICIPHSNTIQIRAFSGSHNCPKETRSPERFSAYMIALLIVDKLRMNPGLKAPAIVTMFVLHYGIDIPYKQALRALHKAREMIFGIQDKSYDELRWQLHYLKVVNPGSHIEFHSRAETNPETCDTKNRFYRAFVAFQAAIEGFAYCRPFLSIDGTFLSGRYEGVLLSATAKDGDNGLFPVAFAIVSVENKDNWQWFLEQLLHIIPSATDVVYVSDRNSSLVSLFENEFSHLQHFYCLHHLKMNLRARFSASSFSGTFKDSVENKLSELARAPTELIFNQKLEELREFSPGIINHFLAGLPLEKWTIAYALCFHFGEMTSNASESYNNWIKVPRVLPIAQCVDAIRSNTMEWFHERRTSAAKWMNKLTPEYQKRWDAALDEGCSWGFLRASMYVYEFTFDPSISVNLSTKKCDCFGWQFSGFPCAHGINAIMLSKLPIEDFIEPYFLAETYAKCYAGIIYPVTSILKHTHSTELGEFVYPPDIERKPGRPATKRIMSSGEPPAKRTYKCSKCGGSGHPARSCKAFISGWD